MEFIKVRHLPAEQFDSGKRKNVKFFVINVMLNGSCRISLSIIFLLHNIGVSIKLFPLFIHDMMRKYKKVNLSYTRQFEKHHNDKWSSKFVASTYS